MEKGIKSGLIWMGGLRAITRILTFIRLGILARLLSPFEFGLFGIAALVLALLETITETGVNVFFIQREGKLKDYLNTSFIVSIIRGVIIALILIIIARPISVFFASPKSVNLILLISVAALLRGFINPAVVKFQKNLEFNKEFLLRFSTAVADVVVSIILALLTKSAVALVWGMIAAVSVEILVSHIFIKPTPRFRFEREKFARVVNRGKWVTLAGIFQYLFVNGDNIVVGRMINTSSLGLYQNAYRISTIPITEISEVFSRVTFPLYSKLADNKNNLLKIFKKYLFLYSLVVIPVGALIGIFAKEIVLVILGSKWLEIVPTLKILSVFGIIRALQGAFPPLFLAIKKQEYVTYLTLASILGLAISIVPLIRLFGIWGAGLSALIGSIFAIPVIVICTLKVFKNS